MTATSSGLELGAVYTRAELERRFAIHDATLKTGIFRPKGHDSVWLFITIDKTEASDVSRLQGCRGRPPRSGSCDRLGSVSSRWRGLPALGRNCRVDRALRGGRGVDVALEGHATTEPRMGVDVALARRQAGNRRRASQSW